MLIVIKGSTDPLTAQQAMKGNIPHHNNLKWLQLNQTTHNRIRDCISTLHLPGWLDEIHLRVSTYRNSNKTDHDKNEFSDILFRSTDVAAVVFSQLASVGTTIMHSDPRSVIGSALFKFIESLDFKKHGFQEDIVVYGYKGDMHWYNYLLARKNIQILGL